MGTPEVWSKALSTPWLWEARRSYLVNELGLSPDDEALGPKRPVVAFYGPSQVGKTTVILRLLGLREDAHSEAEHVLRGERRQGESATVTALRYGLARSQPDMWEVPVLSIVEGKIIEQTKVCDPATARRQFGELRRFLTDSVRGRHLPDNPLWVGVPRNLLSASADPEAAPVMVDLPGEGSGDNAERHHVPQLVSKWLAIASSIVVVLRLNNVVELARLKFGSTEANGNQWVYWPGDLALVLTRAITEGTVRESVRSDMSVAQFRHLIEANGRLGDEILNSSQLSQEAKDGAKDRLAKVPFFPLELGDSLAAMQQQDPQLAAMAAPVLAESMKTLRTHIDAKAREETALLAMSGLRIAAQNRHRATVARRHTEFMAASEKLRSVLENLAQMERDLLEELAYRDELNAKIGVVEQQASSGADQFRSGLFQAVNARKEAYSNDWGPHDLRAAGVDFGNYLYRTAEQLAAECFDQLGPRDFDAWRQRAAAERNLTIGLESHKWNFYMLSSRRDDWKKVFDNAQNYARDQSVRVATTARNAAVVRVQALRQEAKSYIDQIAQLEAEKLQLVKAKREAEVARTAADSAYAAAVAEEARAAVAAKQEDRFFKLASAAFLSNVRERKVQVLSWMPAGDGRRDWTPSWRRHEALADWTGSVLRMERLSGAVSGRNEVGS